MNSSSFRQHDARVRSAALRAFRWRKIQRRCAMVLPLIAVIVIVLVGRTGAPPVPAGASPAETLASKRTLPMTSHTEIARRGAERDRRGHPSYPEKESGATGIKIEMITDEQLIAAFPPGSCYIAEVNGQKQLFFRDPKVKEQFFN